MAEEQGPPRKTSTYKEFMGMNSQDERYGCEDGEFFWLENIMRVGDGKLRSVPGPTAMLAVFPAGPFLLLEGNPEGSSSGFLLLEDGGQIILE